MQAFLTHNKLMRSTLHLLPTLVLAAALFSLAAGCDNEAPPMGGAVKGRDSLPVMVTHGVSKLISDSGVIRYKIITEEWRVFDKTNPPRWEFPKGIFIERYDDKFKVNLHITADSAWLYDQNLWKLRGHIELDDQAAQTHMTTEELFWNMRTGELSSDVYTKLIEPEQEIEGNWFRATLLNKRLTHYHIKQTKGFLPMNDTFDNNPAPAATDTAGAAGDSATVVPVVPLREAPASHRKGS